MYQCTSFYTANRILPPRCNVVVAAWSVTADADYSHDLTDDALGLPKMYCLIRTIDGTGVVQTCHGPIPLEQNSYILLPRNAILEYHSNFKIWSYYWVDFILEENAPDCTGTKLYAAYTDYEKNLFQELMTAGTQHPDEIRYINGIFAHYFFYLRFHSQKKEEHDRQSLQFSEICGYMEQKIYTRLTVQEIADFFGVSPRRIHQIFEKSAGLPPKQYISRLKIEKSKQLLARTSLPIVDIAEALGYDSPYHFSTAFRKREGISPSSYRNTIKKTGESR